MRHGRAHIGAPRGIARDARYWMLFIGKTAGADVYKDPCLRCLRVALWLSPLVDCLVQATLDHEYRLFGESRGIPKPEYIQ